ncbi:hypothetical protein EPTV-WA-154 [Eptesipox virus]|uniref:Uncharacterized protein n=1 Tax=Eptesipox virus TaxID=1329402 RepID=A0A220T6M2_9POXV|nr:hypothetical protein CG743_gp154 [Eptesipox virus]ASK51355.1 hypothetical protein EPTV-WA-154 [Eptesipox virus]WAH71113.1 hypothetical protein CG743_gp154 [Eptesipox virus]
MGTITMYNLLEHKIRHLINIYYKVPDINYILKSLKTQILPEPVINNKFFNYVFKTINSSTDFLKFLIVLLIKNNYLYKVKKILYIILVQCTPINNCIYLNKNMFNDNFLAGIMYNIFENLSIEFDTKSYKIVINNKRQIFDLYMIIVFLYYYYTV